MENMDSLPESSDSTLLNSVDAKGVDYSTAMSLLTEEDPNEEKVNATVEEAKKLVFYDENGRVNGSEWSKAIQIIHKHISWGSQEGLKAWNLAFDKILSPE